MVVGILGFIPAFRSNNPHPEALLRLFADEGYGLLFGLFPVNWIHNLVHLGVGVAGWSLSRGVSQARNFAKGLAWSYGMLAIFGAIRPLSMGFGLVPLHGWDVFLHGGTAALAVYYGYFKQAEADEIAGGYSSTA